MPVHAFPNVTDTTSSTDIDSLSYVLTHKVITPYFQPIFDLLTGEIIGHEALSRGPAESRLHMPDTLFKAAISAGRLHELELLCREKSLQRFAELALPGKLFLNVSASLLSSANHQKGMTLALLKQLGIEQDRIVIELSEQQPYDSCGLTLASVEYYRKMGFSIAIDDLGVGYSGLRLWSDVQPGSVKIDKYFIHQIDKDPVKREFVRSIIAIAQSLHCDVIAEGIENITELELLMELGVTRGQGFYLGRPDPNPQVFAHKQLAQRARRVSQHRNIDEGETVHSLCRTVPTVNSTDTLLTVSELLRDHPDLLSLPVLDQGIPKGVVRRHDLLELFSSQYGRALYETKPVSKLLKKDVLIVESFISLASVSKQLTQQAESALNHEIIIVQDGAFLGVGSLRDLLKRITDLKIHNATYANPLTLLPGSVPINREIDRRLHAAMDFHVAYFDLNDFKPFNDFYGYAKGDEVIQLLGRLIKHHLTSAENFLGHIGGDDFVVIFSCADWAERCRAVLAAFEEQVRDLYAPKELQEGGIWLENRAEQQQFFSLLSVAIGVVHPDSYACESYHEVVELAAEAKKQSKKMGGNALFISRRRKHRIIS